MTSPHLVPDDELPWVDRNGPPPPFRRYDYGESWVLDVTCSCGMRWHTAAGRRAWTKRRGPIRADFERHKRYGHCVVERSVRFAVHNSKLVAAHIVTALFQAFPSLDQIA